MCRIRTCLYPLPVYSHTVRRTGNSRHTHKGHPPAHRSETLSVRVTHTLSRFRSYYNTPRNGFYHGKKTANSERKLCAPLQSAVFLFYKSLFNKFRKALRLRNPYKRSEGENTDNKLRFIIFIIYDFQSIASVTCPHRFLFKM